MALWETEIKEIRQLRRRLMSGKIKPEEVSAHVSLFSQSEKRSKLIMDALTRGEKSNARNHTKLVKAGLIGEETVIDLEDDFKLEKIMCPEKDGVTTRQECYDFSSTTGNLEKCDGCEHFNITRRVLDGEKKE